MACRFHGVPEYEAWRAMRNRVRRSAYYRGITICHRWSVYQNFLADMGARPSPRHTLGRIDNAGNYYPANCRWETMHQQNRNKRSTRTITVAGESLCIADWAKRLGIHRTAISHRLASGWTYKQAVTIPKGKKR